MNTTEINLHLYEGNGVPINQRNQILPEYEPLVDIENPEYYIAEKGLRDAVNVALALGQPLIITGEPGTGKTQLAGSVAYELGLHKPLVFYAKTTSNATDMFYQYDALRRFQDSHIPGKTAINTEDYITYQAFGIAILLTRPPDEVKQFLPEHLKGKGMTRSVVLIDEIDKAPRDMPNDILNEIEKMEFTVKETGRTFTADRRFRPILILTSNSEKNLPDAFLRRCMFYHISFPEKEQLCQIVQKRFDGHPGFTPEFINNAIQHFNDIRNTVKKKMPATAEFLTWISMLQSLNFDKLDINGQIEKLAMSYSVLAKNQEDLKQLKEKLIQKKRA